MGQTTIHQLPYPELTDPADVPTDMRELAERLDAIIPAGGTIPSDGNVVSIPVLDVGMPGQYRAGRQLAPADFTALGLQAPLGLWNLGSLADSSGNGRNLTDKGTVPFGAGINGLATTAAVFSGLTAQALYIPDSGASDPLRIRTGSWGCWFRTAKRGTTQYLIVKTGSAAGQNGWAIFIGTGNNAAVSASPDGSAVPYAATVSDVCDDRWHFIVGTFDGTRIAVYLDGVLEATTAQAGTIFSTTGPVNIGAIIADASTAGGSPFYGRVDEAFVTGDVLSEDQVRCLYAAKLLHGLGAAPTSVRCNVHRYKRGGTLATADFPTAPLRLYNFTNGDLQGAGSDTPANRQLTNNGTAVNVAGADGKPLEAFSFAGAQSLSGTDGLGGAVGSRLPQATEPRSYGCWFKTTSTAGMSVMAWGTTSTGDARVALNAGALASWSAGDSIAGPYAADGQWHFITTVEDNAAGDLVKRKLYLDGRLVGGSTVLNSVALGGANRFRIGAAADGVGPFIGQIDAAFVCGYALTAIDIMTLYAKGSQDAGASPKNAGDHVERVDASTVLVVLDTLQSNWTVDMGVGT